MTAADLDDLLARLPALRIGVVGDYCLDVYWELDGAGGEPSIETGLPTRPIARQRWALGGAGTIVNNLLALGVGRVAAFGVLGNDPFGLGLLTRAHDLGVDTSGLIAQPDDWETMAYVKPLADGAEQSRYDLGVHNRLSDVSAQLLLTRLTAQLPELDAVILNDQMPNGIHIPLVQTRMNALMQQHPSRLFVVDCRHFNAAYPHAVHRVNEREAARLGGDAASLWERWQQPVFVSQGAHGCVVADVNGVHQIPAVPVPGPVDIVGAGDSMLAGLTAALAAGYDARVAGAFGNLVAGVTVQKRHETGTATPREIKELYAASRV